MFKNENEMQKWMRNKLKEKSIDELIINRNKNHTQSFSKNLEKIKKSFNHAYECLIDTVVLTDNHNISLNKTTLRPDFLLYSTGTESIVVVELKNSKAATREAGTELGAYTGAIKAQLPELAESDIVSVVISNEWPNTLKQYIASEIIFSNRQIICLRPVEDEDEHTKLKDIHLEILSIDEFSGLHMPETFSKNDLVGHQIHLYKNDAKQKTNPYTHLPIMLTSLQQIAIKGESLKSHGCAFLWQSTSKDNYGDWSILVLTIPPAKIVLDRINQSLTELSLLDEKILDMYNRHETSGHNITSEILTEEAIETLELICIPSKESYYNVKELHKIMKGESVIWAFCSWGKIRELHIQKINEIYSNGETSMAFNSPQLGIELISSIFYSQFKNGLKTVAYSPIIY